MKMIVKLKLLPSEEQSEVLLKTISTSNKACNYISDVAWKKRVFGKFKLQKEVYARVKKKFGLSAQIAIQCVRKVSDAYKGDKKIKREFRPTGAICYDSRILTYPSTSCVSIRAGKKREKIPFACKDTSFYPFIKGEADLFYKKGKFFLCQTLEMPEGEKKKVEQIIGVDFGQTDIAVCDDGGIYNSQELKRVRTYYSKVRASVQAKGTKGCKKLLKRFSGRERRFVSISNHTISKQLVAKAKAEGKGIAIEDLSHIRKRAKSKSKAMKTELNRWSFYQLRQYLAYKSKAAGVPLFVVPAAYTSKTCSNCLHIGERKGKYFRCEHCGYGADADQNAAVNIATWGRVINQPEESSLLCCHMPTAQV